MPRIHRRKRRARCSAPTGPGCAASPSATRRRGQRAGRRCANPPDNRVFRGFVGSRAAQGHRTREGRADLLGALERKYRFGQHVGLQARVAALVGQRDDAPRLLREGRRGAAAPVADFNSVADFLLDPDWESLADEPEFKAILAPGG